MTGSTLNVRVARKAVEAVDICAIELVSVDGTPLPAFSAGSHIDVHLPGDITRQYSLCNDPTESHRYLIGVLKDPGSRGGSKAMHEQVHEGDVIRDDGHGPVLLRVLVGHTLLSVEEKESGFRAEEGA
jgi:vanillate O-demethylase ferredoxin subunit